MKKILVVDDEVQILKTVKKYLELEGYWVLTAENGFKGLSMYEKEKPQIIITDARMPGMNGIELLKKLKNLDPDNIVVVISGHSDTEIREQAEKAQASFFLDKPVNIGDLINLIEGIDF